jgi:hypothetical protein
VNELEAAVVAAELALLHEKLDRSAISRLATPAPSAPAARPEVAPLARRARRLVKAAEAWAARRPVVLKTLSGCLVHFDNAAHFQQWKAERGHRELEAGWLAGGRLVYK